MPRDELELRYVNLLRELEVANGTVSHSSTVIDVHRATIRTLETTLTIVQTRCTELLLELRKYRESSAMPGIGWDCTACSAFNGDLKESLKKCRCCNADRAMNSNTTPKKHDPKLGTGMYLILDFDPKKEV
jgi:hypothetical protein